MIDTLYNRPVLGSTGALGGWIGSVVATTPIFQFISAFTGSIIGIVTIVGLIYRLYKWITR
jgi:hypothetical protein